MKDMFLPKLSESKSILASHIAALQYILIKKGICTLEELDSAIVKSQAAIDQEAEKIKDDFKKQNPETAKINDLANKLFGS